MQEAAAWLLVSVTAYENADFTFSCSAVLKQICTSMENTVFQLIIASILQMRDSQSQYTGYALVDIKIKMSECLLSCKKVYSCS